MVKFTSVQMGHFIVSSFRGISENSGAPRLQINGSHGWQPRHEGLKAVTQPFNASARPRGETALSINREQQDFDHSCDYTMIRLLLI
jgi:hypothetical protein